MPVLRDRRGVKVGLWIAAALVGGAILVVSALGLALIVIINTV